MGSNAPALILAVLSSNIKKVKKVLKNNPDTEACSQPDAKPTSKSSTYANKALHWAAIKVGDYSQPIAIGLARRRTVPVKDCVARHCKQLVLTCVEDSLKTVQSC